LARRRPHRGWSPAHAERLLWRAGFGGTPHEIDFWGRRSKEATVDWLLRGGPGPHGRRTMVGRPPRVDGKPLDPVNEWGHDVLWWLDRMVRTQRPLVEKLTLLWHDHFATRDQDTPLMVAQNKALRRHALGPFPQLLSVVTTDPAMQAFLSLVDSDKRHPNENFARELMELFTLGVSAGYTERDVRQAARALTGFRGEWRDGRPLRVHYDRAAHDRGVKRVLGHRGRLDWRDVLHACVAHRAHAPFLVEKLWSFFVTEPLGRPARARLARTYVRSGHRIAPVVREILLSRALFADLHEPRMVKWPVVHVAGMLRQAGRPVDTGDWAWILQLMGQSPFSPPSVAGWDWGAAWMSTATMHARFVAATWMTKDPPVAVREGSADPRWSAAEHVRRARRATGRPRTSAATDRELARMAHRFLTTDVRRGQRVPDFQADLTQAALRHLLLAAPEASLC
jgi:uncharacterized protein (DUF1800 family)